MKDNEYEFLKMSKFKNCILFKKIEELKNKNLKNINLTSNEFKDSLIKQFPRTVSIYSKPKNDKHYGYTKSPKSWHIKEFKEAIEGSFQVKIIECHKNDEDWIICNLK